MSVLVDTNVLLRSVQSSHPMHVVALKSLEVLVESGTPSFIAIQSAAEFWNVLTRPLENNGAGLPVEEAEAELSRFESTLGVVHESLRSFSRWKVLVSLHGVRGVSVHDARLVSVMLAEGITHILTFNTKDFARYTEITAIHPTALAG